MHIASSVWDQLISSTSIYHHHVILVSLGKNLNPSSLADQQSETLLVASEGKWWQINASLAACLLKKWIEKASQEEENLLTDVMWRLHSSRINFILLLQIYRSIFPVVNCN